MANVEAKRKLLPKDFEQLLVAGDLAAVQAVFDTCDVNARGGASKHTALAFDTCPDELARWLVQRGADLEATDSWDNTPLHDRAQSGRGSIAVLLELGANVHAMNATGTPLHIAAESRQAENAKLLLAAGADVNAHNERELTPLEVALHNAHSAYLPELVVLVRVLLAAGAMVTPAISAAVTRIGTTFEFHRAGFPVERLPAGNAALADLYALFDVPPVPCRGIPGDTSPIAPTVPTWQKAQRR